MREFHQVERLMNGQLRLCLDRSIRVVFLVQQGWGFEFQFQRTISPMPLEVKPAIRHRHDLRRGAPVGREELNEVRDGLDHVRIGRIGVVAVPVVR